MSEETGQGQQAVELRGVVKEYRRDEFSVLALNNVDLDIPRNDFLALMGPSGSGKSTMLHLIAGIDRPTAGRLTVLGDDIGGMGEKELAAWRSEHIGYIFQTFNLIPVLTALENVELPLLLTRLSKKQRLENAKTALDIVGLSDRLDHYPRQLSGGQEQRVAIARAIVTDPAIILADEPTGDLDAASAKEALNALALLNEQHGKTIVIVTHDPHAARVRPQDPLHRKRRPPPRRPTPRRLVLHPRPNLTRQRFPHFRRTREGHSAPRPGEPAWSRVWLSCSGAGQPSRCRRESDLIPLAPPKHPLPHHFTAPSPPGCGNAETLKSLTIRLGLCYLGSDFLGGVVCPASP